MPLWQIFYHAVWATQYRESRISSEVEPFVYDLLKTKARALDAKVFALNGMPDHVHTDAKRLPHHVAYVENQKTHHAKGTVIPVLERTSEETD